MSPLSDNQHRQDSAAPAFAKAADRSHTKAGPQGGKRARLPWWHRTGRSAGFLTAGTVGLLLSWWLRDLGARGVAGIGPFVGLIALVLLAVGLFQFVRNIDAIAEQLTQADMVAELMGNED